VERGIRDALVPRGLVDVKVAFVVVDPLQRVAGAFKSWKFDNSAFLSCERSLAGLGRPQELVNGIETPQHLGKHDLHLLLPCPDVGAGIQGGSGN
jgi:hypothetical protein